jgi:hypothetical protein
MHGLMHRQPRILGPSLDHHPLRPLPQLRRVLPRSTHAHDPLVESQSPRNPGRFNPNRYQDAKRRRCYAGTAPITRASGTRRTVLARFIHNDRLVNACMLWAFAALTRSPGARTYYDARRQRGATHHQALRALANRLVGILHGCLRHRTRYDEDLAWRHQTTIPA